MNATAEMQWRSPVYRSVSSLSVASDFPEARFWIVSGSPTIHEEILKQHRRRLSGEAARKHGLNQKDFKSATTQAAPVTSKVRTHSDQLKCAFG